MTYYTAPGIKMIAEDLTPEMILLHASDYFNCSKEQISSRTRKHPVVSYRHMTMMAMVNYGYTLSEVARFFEMDHTSVIHARKAVSDLSFSDPVYKEQYEGLKTHLRAIL